MCLAILSTEHSKLAEWNEQTNTTLQAVRRFLSLPLPLLFFLWGGGGIGKLVKFYLVLYELIHLFVVYFLFELLLYFSVLNSKEFTLILFGEKLVFLWLNTCEQVCERLSGHYRD